MTFDNEDKWGQQKTLNQVKHLFQIQFVALNGDIYEEQRFMNENK